LREQIGDMPDGAPTPPVGRQPELVGKNAETVSLYAQNGAAQELNAALRHGGDVRDVGSYSSLTGTTVEGPEMVVRLDELIEQASLSEDLVVHRGVTGRGAWADELRNAQPGDTFEDAGYMSTTASDFYANNFTQSGGVTFDIHLPRGSNALDLRGWNDSGAEEIVLPRGTRLRVDEIVREESITRVIASVVR
jgi:hypothetical protein